MLNSHWEKFGQNPNKSKLTYMSDIQVYIDMMTDDTIDVTELLFVNDAHVWWTWNSKDDFVEALPNTNVILAAYTMPKRDCIFIPYRKGWKTESCTWIPIQPYTSKEMASGILL